MLVVNFQELRMTDSKSALPKPLQDLIRMIFDIDQMKKAMIEFEVLFAKPAAVCLGLQESVELGPVFENCDSACNSLS